MVVVGLVWRWIAVYQVVDGLSAKGADQVDGQLDDKDQQDERGQGEHGGGILDSVYSIFLVVDCMC